MHIGAPTDTSVYLCSKDWGRIGSGVGTGCDGGAGVVCGSGTITGCGGEAGTGCGSGVGTGCVGGRGTGCGMGAGIGCGWLGGN